MNKPIKKNKNPTRSHEDTKGELKPRGILFTKSSVHDRFWGFFICFVFASFLNNPGWGDTPPKDLSVVEVSQKVEEAQSSAQDVQMDLKMEMKDALSGAKQQVAGVIKIKSPDLVYVHYTKPTQQFLYAGGSLMQMYQPDQKMVYQQRVGGGKGSEPVYLGVGKELKKYIAISRVSIIKNSDSEVGLLFLPLSDNAGFDKMKVYIHKKDWWPYRMEVETPSMTTRAEFSNFSFNKGLKADLFQFTPPKGTQVVEGQIF